MDGLVLAKLLKILTGDDVPKIKSGQTLRRIQMIENCNLDLRFMKAKGVILFNIGSEGRYSNDHFLLTPQILLMET